MILIRGAQLHDPSRGVDGQVGDLWVQDGRIVSPPQSEEDATRAEVIDARGLLLAPAGVEIHTHVAGYGLNAARRFLPDDPDVLDLLAPAARTAAERYLCLGCTTVFDAASAPLLARTTLADLQKMDQVDRGTYTLLGDNLLLLKALAARDLSAARDTLAWLLAVSGGYAVKLVNPGGGLAWKAGHPAPELDELIGLESLTQRQVICTLVELVNGLGLPHPVHLHAGRLGRPGNYPSFLDTVRALDGQRAHLCHIQFYAYGADAQGGYTSAAEQVVSVLEKYPRLTFDVGQVIFGSALAVSADTSGLDGLRRQLRQPWISRQLEGEGGTSALPLTYLARDPSSAVQWATGLELLLRFPRPERMFLTSDHPNGGPFSAYPQVIAWLMNRSARREALSRVHPAARRKTGLEGLEREYSLGEVFAMTSWGPAQALGLSDRGHLGVGARADLRCYQPQSNIQAMFAKPAWVMQNGRIVVREGSLVGAGSGDILVVRPAWDRDRLPRLQAQLSDIISLPARCFALGQEQEPIEGMREVPCTGTAS